MLEQASDGGADFEAAYPHTLSGVDLYHAGYRTLVSIIPPDADLSAQSRIDPSQCGKIPGRRGSDGRWAGYDWINRHTPSLDDVRRWSRDGAGIGFACGVGDAPLLAIDIDVTDPALAEAVTALAHRHLGPAPCRVGQWPKALLLYAIDDLSDPVTWQRLRFDVGGGEHLVEIHGQGRQFVAAGTHPKTGAPYRWDTDLADEGPGTLIPLDTDDLARFFGAVRAWVEAQGGDVVVASGGGKDADRTRVDQDRLAAVDLDWLDRVVNALPNGDDDYPHRDDYVRVGCAIKAAYRADEARGLEAWQDWCAKWPGGNDPDVVEADWARMHPPFEVGAGWLEEQARLKGGLNAAERLFTPSPHASPSTGRGLSADDAGAEGDDPFEPQDGEFWDRYVWVEGIKRFADLKTGALLDKEQFNDRYCGRVGTALSGLKSPAGVYLSFASRRVVAALTYRPLQGPLVEEAHGLAVNTWQPGPAHGWKGEHWAQTPATEADVRPWLDLVARLVPDERSRALLLDWLAWQVQRPGEKCNWHPLLWGEQGVGKDTLLVPLVRALGDHERGNAAIVQAAELSGDWTDWFENKSLIVVEEINSFERRSIADKLKPMLTTPPHQLRVNRKHVAPYAVPNVANFFFLSNHADAMPLEQGDRRMFILEAACSAADFGAGYFEALYDWYDLGGDMLVVGWLGSRDLSAFRANGNAPDTAAKAAMRELGLGQAESLLVHAIEDEAGIFRRDLVLLDEVREFLRTEGVTSKLSPHRVSAILRGVGAVSLGRVRLSGGERGRVWAVRRAATYRQAADAYGGVAGLFEKQRAGEAAGRAQDVFAGRKGPG